PRPAPRALQATVGGGRRRRAEERDERDRRPLRPAAERRDPARRADGHQGDGAQARRGRARNLVEPGRDRPARRLAPARAHPGELAAATRPPLCQPTPCATSLVGARRSCYRIGVTMQNSGYFLLVALALAGACDRKADGEGTAQARAQGGPSAPPQSSEELGTPLATIDDVTITLGEFQERINRQSPYIRARYTSLEQKKEFLDSLIRFEVLAKEAYRRGMQNDPEVVRTMKQVMIQKLMRDEFDSKVTADSISDA